MPWIRCPVIGTGTREDMYRPEVHGILPYSVDIPTHPVTGAPLHPNCVVWVPDGEVVPTPLPAGWTIMPEAAAKGLIAARDPNANAGAMKWRP